MTTLLAMVIRPLVALILFGGIVIPLGMAFERYFPDGKVKRFLLTPLRRNTGSSTLTHRR